MDKEIQEVQLNKLCEVRFMSLKIQKPFQSSLDANMQFLNL